MGSFRNDGLLTLLGVAAIGLFLAGMITLVELERLTQPMACGHPRLMGHGPIMSGNATTLLVVKEAYCSVCGEKRRVAVAAWNRGYREGVTDGAPYPSEADLTPLLEEPK